MATENIKLSQVALNEDEILERLERIFIENKDKPGSLIPLLQLTQKTYGYLPMGALQKISEHLNIPISEVAGVVGFYSFFSTTPKGKNVIRVCQGTACYVRGGHEVLNSVKNELKIEAGETTEDRLFSLEIGRCFGACGLAPVIMINNDVIQRIKPSKISEILKVYKK